MRPAPEIRDLAGQPAAVERAKTDVEGLGATIDRAFPTLFGQLARLGIPPAGPPFIRYLKTGERFEIELGVPLPEGVGELEGVNQATLPAGRTAIMRYIGPYDGLRNACEQLVAWVEERDEEAAGPHWETYVTDPRTEPDASKRITEIYLPLES
jgi:effector-binding domain-containing protein